MKRLQIAATICVCLMAANVHAQPTEKSRWYQVRSQHFEIYSNAPEGKTREIAESLLDLQQAFAALGVKVDDIVSSPPTFIVFKNQDVFLPYMSEAPAKGTYRSWESHFSTHRSYLLLDGSRPAAELRPYTYDSYSRYLVSAAYPELPRWLKRGMAEFYSTITIDKKGRIRLGLTIAQHLEAVSRYGMSPLVHFFALNPDPLQSDRIDRRRYEAQAWLTSHFLIVGSGDKSPAFFQALLEGATEEEAVQAAFGTDLSGLLDQIRTYARGLTMPFLTLTAENYEKPTVTTEVLSNSEANLLLASYLVNGLRPPNAPFAARHLAALTESELKGDASALRGQLEVAAGSAEAAERFFRESAEHDFRDPMNAYNAGLFWSSRSDAESRGLQRDAFQQAVNLDPSFSDAWARLASAYSSKAPQKIEALEKALALEPDESVWAHNLAMAHLNNGDVEAAQRMVDKYLRQPSPERDRMLNAIGLNKVNEQRSELADTFNEAVSDANRGHTTAACEALASLASEPLLLPRMARAVAEMTKQLACE